MSKTWGSHRVLRCMSVNGKGEVVAGGGRRSTEVESDDGDDPGIEEVREKLLAHLREAADRMKLVVPSPPKDAGRKAQPAPAQEERLDPEVDISAAPPARPWNLRTRRGAARAPTGVERLLSESPPGAVVKRTVRRRPEDPGWRERPKFSISLTRDEIEEDIYAVTGRRARRRPRKRARVFQKQLDALFPGSWLTEITADTYRVPDSR
ncbi:hypothetical protein BHE74_00000499 [Ensete ventricosum]|nr:hypothetical protein BHE74_00000499 [Ensete ventricosum]